MTDNIPGAAHDGGPDGLTDAEKLAALETYIKVLEPVAKALRLRVTLDMGRSRVEKVGAYLPDGTKMASVSRSEGAERAKVTNDLAALAWCLERHPDEVETVQVIRPAFLKMLLDAAKAAGTGVDPRTGEALPFIEVQRGAPYVSISTTEGGVERMTALAHGFAGMLEAGA